MAEIIEITENVIVIRHTRNIYFRCSKNWISPLPKLEGDLHVMADKFNQPNWLWLWVA